MVNFIYKKRILIFLWEEYHYSDSIFDAIIFLSVNKKQYVEKLVSYCKNQYIFEAKIYYIDNEDDFELE